METNHRSASASPPGRRFSVASPAVWKPRPAAVRPQSWQTAELAEAGAFSYEAPASPAGDRWPPRSLRADPPGRDDLQPMTSQGRFAGTHPPSTVARWCITATRPTRAIELAVCLLRGLRYAEGFHSEAASTAELRQR